MGVRCPVLRCCVVIAPTVFRRRTDFRTVPAMHLDLQKNQYQKRWRTEYFGCSEELYRPRKGAAHCLDVFPRRAFNGQKNEIIGWRWLVLPRKLDLQLLKYCRWKEDPQHKLSEVSQKRASR